MWDEFTPYGGGAISVDGAESSDEVVLEGLDGSLCCVHSMVMRFYQLDFDVIIFKVFLNCFAGHVVDDVEARFESSFG